MTCSLQFQLRQRHAGRRHGNIDVAKWDGERFGQPKLHMETQRYPGLYSGNPPAKGKIYDKKPFRIDVVAGKTYHWCSCGHSKTQVSDI